MFTDASLKAYPWPCELAFFCYMRGKGARWTLEKTLRLLDWNVAKQRWVDDATGKVGRRCWTPRKASKARWLLTSAWGTQT